MEIFKQLGRVAIGTRVRFLGDKIGEDARKIYSLYGIEMNPKWFPVFFVLSKSQDKTISAIAEDIGHSHASVSKIVSEMAKAGLVKEKTGTQDRRRTIVGLTKAGKDLSEKIEDQYVDVKAAVDELSAESRHDLWEALEEWEYHLSQRTLYQRVLEMKQRRELSDIKIMPYNSKYQPAFRKLNLDWIKTYFKVEKADRLALDNPKGYILDRGGFIFVAKWRGQPVGVCALLKRDDPRYPYELAKMAVSPEARGKKIGWLLGRAVIEKARALGAERLFLESNTILKPAIGLYQSLGFKKIIGPPSPYERCNIQMELELN